MISIYRANLYIMCLMCFASSANSLPNSLPNSLQTSEVSLLDSAQAKQKICPVGPETAGLTGRVTFVHGKVIDQKGQNIEAGRVLGTCDELYVNSDGFISIHLSDGRTLNIQPNTSTTIASTLVNQSEKMIINQPYFSGGVRG